MIGEHPEAWATRHVKAQALREAAADFTQTGSATWMLFVTSWLEGRAEELDER
jgi:hypothetical protein